MLEVLYEDNHLIAINKRSGDIVQGDKTGDTPLSDFVKAYIKKKYKLILSLILKFYLIQLETLQIHRLLKLHYFL